MQELNIDIKYQAKKDFNVSYDDADWRSQVEHKPAHIVTKFIDFSRQTSQVHIKDRDGKFFLTRNFLFKADYKKTSRQAS